MAHVRKALSRPPSIPLAHPHAQLSNQAPLPQKLTETARAAQVEFSKQLNESRIKVLQAREDAVHNVLREGYAALAALSKDASKYRALIVDLLVQVRGGVSPTPFRSILM